MPSTTWHTSLSTVTDPNTMREIRQWLKRNGAIVPSRDADAVAKYLHLAISATNQWGGVDIPLSIKRPRVQLQPWQQGYEDERSRRHGRSSKPDRYFNQLAQGAFGLLLLLAVVATFGW